MTILKIHTNCIMQQNAQYILNVHNMKPKIYSIDSIIDRNISDSDVERLMSSSFTLSFIAYEFRLAGDTRDPYDIIECCKTTEDWYNDAELSDNEYSILKQNLIKGYMNIWQYSEEKCSKLADMWLLNYGLRRKI